MTMIMSHCLMVSMLCIAQANMSFISTQIESEYWNIEWNFLYCSLTLSRSFTVLTMAPSLCSMLTFFHSPLLSFIFFPLFFFFFLADVLNASTASYGQEGKCIVCECVWVADKQTWYKN